MTIALVGDDLDAIGCQIVQSADVIPVMMREPNGAQLESLAFDHTANGCVLTRVHTRGISAVDD